jgi:2,3-bisphosphoglycerate-independent phosphoglycerate mutase
MKPVLLCILDGVGIREEKLGNAFKNANTPNFDFLWENYPHAVLNASEEYVGLPKGQMGNSEVGHTNIGAGRIVYQSLELINKSFKNHEIDNNEKLLEIISYVKKNNKKLHIMGLTSDGGIHSHIDHLNGIISIAQKHGLEDKIFIHAITDGRDTLYNSSYSYIEKLKSQNIASISGRYYAMDRDKRYERTNLYFDTITGNNITNMSIKDYINNSYANNETDEFIKPALFIKDGKIEKDDALIWINFRPDRAIQIVNKIISYGTKVLTMMKINNEISAPYLFSHEKIKNTLGEYLSNLGYTQARIAETEKYAHVTYFFDGGETLNLKGCDQILIPSPKVATYDLKPEMSAYEITDTLLAKIDNYDFIILNFANGDMVGHTGNYEKAIEAVEHVDICLGKIINKINEKHGLLIITADHGNCDYMFDKEGNIITSHSLSVVPFIVMKKDLTLTNGNLSDIASTILELCNIDIPKEMTGKSLIKK